jgi:hypothetical protein
MTTQAASLAAALRAHLDLQPGESLYGVVDAAQDVDFALDAERRFGLPMRMLFKGEAAQYMREVAPYLIPIPLDSEYLDAWAKRWGRNVGILLTSAADPNTVLRHLREIFVVKDEAGQEYFFRFYDPRVLRPYLPVCTAEEIRQFLGPIRVLLVEGSETGSLLRFGPGVEGALQENKGVGTLCPWRNPKELRVPDSTTNFGGIRGIS